jgi:hypothetical protein
MIKIEKEYKGKAFFNDDKSVTWDSFRRKSYKLKIFGLTLYQTSEDLNIDYSEVKIQKMGFKG